MRLATLVRLILYMATIAVITVTFKWVFTPDYRVQHKSQLIYPDSKEGNHGELDEFCQPLHSSPRGAEAAMHGDDYRLEAVFLLTRHGQRAPMVSLSPDVAKNGCGLKFSQIRDTFGDFRNCLNKKSGSIFNLSQLFTQFPMYPENDDCHAGELTKSGVVQMIQLGRWFRRQYSPLFNRPVFNGETAAAVEVFSTVYSRTLQSALGFLHGLSLPPTSTQATCAESSRSKFFIQPSSATHFCLKPSCYCAKLSFLHDQFHSEQLEKSEDIGGVVLKGIMRKALNILGRSQSGIEAQRLFDILCGGYVCRNSQLPCDQAGGECVTTEELTGLYSVLKRRNAEMFTSRSFKAMSVGESYYLLQEILARIHQLIDGEETTVEAKKRFFYFSGHDVSIRPLLRALEIKDSNQIRYSARLVFELYRQTMSDKRYVRILYNGEDVSRRVPFCKKWLEFNVALCAIQDFEDFVGISLLRGVGATSINQFCRS